MSTRIIHCLDTVRNISARVNRGKVTYTCQDTNDKIYYLQQVQYVVTFSMI